MNNITRASYLKALSTVTTAEATALKSFYQSSKGNGHDFGWSGDIEVNGMNKQQVGGVISSLVQKGLISEPDTDEYKGQTEFVCYMNEGFSKYDAAEIVEVWAFENPSPVEAISVKPTHQTPAERMAWVRAFKKGAAK